MRAWIDDDPDPDTADELRALLRAPTREPAGLTDGRRPGPDAAPGARRRHVARDELADRFAGLLQFGTAGPARRGSAAARTG